MIAIIQEHKKYNNELPTMAIVNTGFGAQPKIQSIKPSPPNLLIWLLKEKKLKTKYKNLALC